MYYKIILSVFMLFSLCSCAIIDSSPSTPRQEAKYVKAVWLTYYEFSNFTEDKNEKSFKKKVSTAFKNLKNNGFNRVTVQVRPFADAFYPSEYFPSSSYCFGEQGSPMPFDPLKIMCDLAEKFGLEIEAWINPYRISNQSDFSDLSAENIALKWKDTDNLIVCEQGIYFNPASDSVRKLICDGVKEIAENYNVESICFDDYFYPSTNKNIDKESYKKYKGSLSLDDWRRDNIDKLISEVYKTVKSVDDSISFGISPASNIEANYNNLYADVEKWSTNEGYIDYICPQIYFGFQNENQPFMKTAKLWSKMAECKLYVALPLYKQGLTDEFAGDLGMNEFVENNNIISRQVTYLSKLEEIDGFYIFSYSSLNDGDETKNLYSAMQTSS